MKDWHHHGNIYNIHYFLTTPGLHCMICGDVETTPRWLLISSLYVPMFWRTCYLS